MAIGPQPVKVLERLDQLPNSHIIRGNSDRYTCSRERPSPSIDQVKSDFSQLPTLIEVEASFSWTQGAVTAAGWLPWLNALPLDFQTTLPNGTRVLCVHASPGNDDGPGFKLDMDKEEIKSRLADCMADLICVGHTHRPFHIQVNGTTIINPGSVSNHVGPDVRASYARLTAGESDFNVEYFRVAYNQTAVIRNLEEMNHPDKEFINKHLRGKF